MTGSGVLDRIWASHREAMLGRVAVAWQAAAAMRAGRLDDELHEEALGAAHQLAGTLGTFGFERAGGAAKAIEALLRTPGARTEADGRRMEELLEELSADLADDVDRRPAAAEAPEAVETRAILFVDEDETLTTLLAEEAERRGLVGRVARTPQQARAAIELEPPSAVVLDVSFAGGPESAHALLTHLADELPGHPGARLHGPGRLRGPDAGCASRRDADSSRRR